MLWPRLQFSIQYDYQKAIHHENADTVSTVSNGRPALRKSPLCVPHDLGDPAEDPWLLINAYHMHDTSDWKDLNVKFVLQVYRDYVFTGNMDYLRDMYETCSALMRNSTKWDTDNDGLIESSGYPDQTYDSWPMSGASAYVSGLWLSALVCVIEMAQLLGRPAEEVAYFQDFLDRGRQSLVEKLWNGQYFNYDGTHKGIMADQLCGHWFLKSCQLPDGSVYQKEHVATTLRTIFQRNVLPFREGTMGAINGILPDGRLDKTGLQSVEFWCGVTYSLGALMILEGMWEEGFQTAGGVYRHCYERLGLGFQTPESYTLSNSNCFRCLGYMRPLAIWGIQHAVEVHDKNATGHLG